MTTGVQVTAGYETISFEQPARLFLLLLMMSMTPLPVAASSVSEINCGGTQICHMFSVKGSASRQTPFSSPLFMYHLTVRCCHVAAVSLRLPPAVNQPIETEAPAGSHLQTPLSHPATCDPRRHTGEQLLLAARRETNQVEPDSPEREGRGGAGGRS